jgi:uncharacterized protein involved in outer membrane biogenesis
MRSRRRLLMTLLLGLLGIVVVALVAVPRLVPEQKVRDLVADRLASATGGQVSLGGASVRILPRLRVVLDDCSLEGTGSELAQATGASTPLSSYAVSVQQLEIDIALWPLLSKRLQTGTIRLVRPHAEIVTRPQQVAAAPAGPTGTGAAPAAGGAGSGMSWELAVAGVEIRDGHLQWREQPTGREVTIDGWQQDVTAGDMALLLERLQAFAAGPTVASTPAAVTGAEARLALQTRVGELTFRPAAEAPPLQFEDLFLQGILGAANADSLTVTLSKAGWRDLVLAADLAIRRPAGHAREGTAPSPAGGTAPGPFRIDGRWRLTPVALADLSDEAMHLAGAQEGPLTTWLAGKPLRAGKLEMEGKLDLEWPLPATAPVSDLMRRLSLTAAISQGRIELPREAGEVELETEFQLAGGRFLCRRLDLANGPLTLSGQAELPLAPAEGPLVVQARGEAELVAAQDLLAVLMPVASAASGPPAGGDAAGSAPAASLPRLAGRLNWHLDVRVDQPPPLTAPQEWRQRLAAGRLGAISLEAQIPQLSVSEGLPGGPWNLGAAELRSDLRTGSLSLRGVDNEAVRGDLKADATQLMPAPLLDVEVSLAYLDVDRLRETFAGQISAARVGPLPPGQAQDPASWWGGLVPAAHAQPPAPSAAPAAGRKAIGEIIPAQLVMNLTGTADKVILQKAPYTQVDIHGKLADRVLAIDELKAQRQNGRITGKGKLDFASDPQGVLGFSLEIDQVPAAALLQPYLPSVGAIWEGSVSASSEGSLRLADQSRQIVKSLTVDGSAVSSNGTLDLSEPLAGIAPYLGNRADLRVVRFDKFTQVFAVQDGRYLIRNLRVDGKQTDWTGEGWIGFDGKIDMQVSVKLPADFQPDLGDLTPLAEALRGEDGRIKLELHLTGPARQPKVSLDLQQAKQQAQQKAEEAVRKGLEGLLDKWKRD